MDGFRKYYSAILGDVSHKLFFIRCVMNIGSGAAAAVAVPNAAAAAAAVPNAAAAVPNAAADHSIDRRWRR